MVIRYGYTWEYLKLTEAIPPKDDDGNPIAATEEWIPFECDVQTSSGNFVTNENGDKISVTYSIFTKVDTGLARGGKVRDENGKEYTVLQVHNYKLNYEVWV